MRRSLAFLFGALLAGVLAAPAVAADADGSEGADGFTIKDPRITESSGLVASRAHPGVYWTHNDSDDGAFLYAVDSRTGETVATVTMSGVGAPRDVEAISIGPDGNLYVGDIGDNLGGTWDHVWIYELPEPKQLKDQTIRATQYDVKYADGARDAEALMVHPKTGRVYIASKNEDGGGLYEGPAQLSTSGTNTFKRIDDIDLWVTDGAFSPDGKQLAVRGYFGGIAYEWNGGKLKKQGRLSVPLQGQGESVTYTPDGSTLLYGSEGGESSVEAGNVPGGGGKSPSEGGGSAAGDDGGDGGDGPNADFKMGAIALAVALAVVFGLKRLLRRG
ncbi:WD40 repeat domain-containing protein [Streptomyces sp. NPDC050704]|uniref:WD40 repeat domain-containing protein n=1 Tax=Streptomyces sp. NPDC050704 TaxID=3157219 RepID=UPI0034445CD6